MSGLAGFTGPAEPLGLVVAVAPDRNNDNADADHLNKITFDGMNVTGFEPIDLEILVDNSGGTIEYLLNLGTANNHAGDDWSGFVIELGTGVGEQFVPLGQSLLPARLLAPLDFDAPDWDPALSAPSGSPTPTAWSRLGGRPPARISRWTSPTPYPPTDRTRITASR